MYTKKQLAEEFGKPGNPLTVNTVRTTLKSCGMSTTAQSYTEDEVKGRFAVARRMIDEEKKTYEDVARHFQVDARQIKEKEEPASTQAFASNQATEATGGMEEIAFKTADKIATPYAQKIAELVPALTMYRLNEMMAGGAMEAGFEKVWDSIDANLGNSQALLMQGLEREQRKLMPSSDSTPLSMESMESSEPE